MGIDHYENFPVASIVLPARLRAPVTAIYRFARCADDIADEGDATAEQRLAGLAELRAALRRIESGEPAGSPMLDDLACTIRAWHLSMEPFDRLLDAFCQDVTVKRYADFAALMGYCRNSADPVGRLMLALYGVDDEASRQGSDQVCSGLQIVNFIQDVASDWQRGRVYLPQEDLARFGLCDDDIARQTRAPAWRDMMRFQTARAAAMLAHGWPLARRVGGRIGLELRLVVAGASTILRAIDAVDGDIFRRRPTLGRSTWVRVAWHALRGESRLDKRRAPLVE